MELRVEELRLWGVRGLGLGVWEVVGEVKDDLVTIFEGGLVVCVYVWWSVDWCLVLWEDQEDCNVDGEDDFEVEDEMIQANE